MTLTSERLSRSRNGFAVALLEPVGSDSHRSRDGVLLRSSAGWPFPFAWEASCTHSLSPAAAQQPPKDLLRRLAAQGSLFEKERESYSYRRSFSFHEMDRHGARTGSYREVREVLFTPEGERIEEFIGPPDSRLRRIQLTEEDFRDLREVQPYVLTKDTLWRYQLVYKGPESVDGVLCYVYRISPRQILEGDRMLDGLIWVSHAEEQIVRVAGRPVPQIHGAEQENLFPQFTTLYEPIDGRFWFPVKTVASDILPFSSGLQRVHYVILYSGYKRFTAESKIVFDRP